MARVRANPQTSLYETTIENPELVKALDLREKLKGDVASAKKRLEDATARAHAIIAELDISDAPVRVGRYVIAEKRRPGRTVQSFEVQPKVQISISLLPEDLE